MSKYDKTDVQKHLRAAGVVADFYAKATAEFHEIRHDVASTVRKFPTSQIPITGELAHKLMRLFESDEVYEDVYEKLRRRYEEISPKQNSVEAKRAKQRAAS